MKNYLKGVIVRSLIYIIVLLLASLLLLFLNKGLQEQIMNEISLFISGIVIMIIVLIKAIILYNKVNKYDRGKKYEEN